MEMKLHRTEYLMDATEGILYVDGAAECFTIEDKDRNLELGGVKIQNKTAIPKGVYEVQVTYSNRFKRDMPILLNVPQFTGVRIHTGNTAEDTEGCIIVGSVNTTQKDGFIGNSKVAFNKLFPKIVKAINDGEKVTVEIV